MRSHDLQGLDLTAYVRYAQPPWKYSSTAVDGLVDRLQRIRKQPPTEIMLHIALHRLYTLLTALRCAWYMVSLCRTL